MAQRVCELELEAREQERERKKTRERAGVAKMTGGGVGDELFFSAERAAAGYE